MARPVYTDCNVLWQREVDLTEFISHVIKLGYERVVINNCIEDLRGGKKEREKVVIASPSEIKLKEDDLKQIQRNGKFEQLSRLTALLSDASNTHKLSSPEIQAYDIIAVQPTNEKTFQDDSGSRLLVLSSCPGTLACSTLEVDIITFNLTERLDFRLKRPLVKLAAERGIHFEICYSHAFHDSVMKRQLLSNAMDLVDTTKGKNIILSSGSNKAIHLRSPYDLINLSKVIGLTPVQAKNVVTTNTRAVVMRAATRKSCKSVVSTAMVSQLPVSDRWVVDAHNRMLKGSDTDSDSEEYDDDDDNDNVGENDEVQPRKKIKLKQ